MSSFFRSRPHFVLGACLVGTAVLALASPGYGQPAPIKIAVVSLDAVAASSSAGKALSQKLDAFQQQVKGEAEVAANKMRDIQRQAAEGANSLSETRLTELQKEYEDAQIALKRLRDDRQREGQKMQEEGLRAIESQMEPVFQAIRDEEGYDLILNYVPGVVVMAVGLLESGEETSRSKLSVADAEQEPVVPWAQLDRDTPSSMLRVGREVPPGVPVALAEHVAVAVDEAVKRPVHPEGDLIGRAEMENRLSA